MIEGSFIGFAFIIDGVFLFVATLNYQSNWYVTAPAVRIQFHHFLDQLKLIRSLLTQNVCLPYKIEF